MGARQVQDLVVWQLADEIRRSVYALLAHGPATKDWTFCDQLRDATASVARNVVEGFGRETHREFARFLVIARGSLFEVQEHLRDGIARGYWPPSATTELDTLCRRAIAAVTSLVGYLRSGSARPRAH
jgi:four helix bundle protein